MTREVVVVDVADLLHEPLSKHILFSIFKKLSFQAVKVNEWLIRSGSPDGLEELKIVSF